jgi:SAM-dependent methyltransferase
MHTVTTQDASIRVYERNAKRVISVEPRRRGFYVAVKQWESEYPLELIEHVLRVKGPAFLCDEIMRDESPLYVQHSLRWDLLSYAGIEDFSGRRLLDFGSGSGASSVVLARMFPHLEIVGVELLPALKELAEHRARFHGVDGRVSFLLSPDSKSLPPGIGEFDYVLLSGVFEHLHPAERLTLLPLLWLHLKEGGIIFVDQSPYRWFPLELHTTRLPLINVLPDRLALYCARRFSRRVRRDESWPELLRRGIRGGSAPEIMRILNRQGRSAALLEPSRLGVNDRIDLWYQISKAKRAARVKRLMKWGFRTVKTMTGAVIVPDLSLAIRKVH